ncbi:uncharacterized protein LOC129732240 [Wyeomyia smithii]|uniref:uncharacterized protein LOC129732240 n=1 Tax=Wyeomyia smithii TaxID=174621 RepID=UPI002467C8B9|nr:uncharacterized protein LOC129732240 [Wyeomyia smithii]
MTEENIILLTIPEEEQLSDEEYNIQELNKLLVEDWDLDSVVCDILTDHGITLPYLKIMDQKALDDIFSVLKWTGHKHALRARLEEWKDSVLFRPQESPGSSQLNEPGPSGSRNEKDYTSHPGPFKHKLLSTAVTNCLLLDILQRNEKGKIVSQYYGKKHKLKDEHKRSLAHTIVDFYIAHDEYIHLPDMERFAQLIVARFPPEIAETYYNPRDSAAGKLHPSGLLYDRFHNRKKTVRAKHRTTVDPWKKCCSKITDLSSDDIELQTSIKNWLRNNLDPFEKVQHSWQKTVLLRCKAIEQETDANKSNVLNKWPRIRDPNGYLLIDEDFDYIYGDTSHSDKLYGNWSSFLKVFHDYISSCKLKDQHSLRLLEHLNEDSIAEDTRNFIYCCLFHAVAKPPRTSLRKLPTVLQAQIDTCNVCNTVEEYVTERDTLRKQIANENNLEFSPRIFVVGHPEKLEAFYVVTQNLEYKLPSFSPGISTTSTIVVNLKTDNYFNFLHS